MNSELTINVDCKLSVSRETAETCLKLVEMFLNENRGYYICVEHGEFTKSLSFAEYPKCGDEVEL